MPPDMPSDAVLNEFESNVVAAQGLFWARTYKWLFEPWRDADFGAMSETATELKAAMRSECEVVAGDIERVMAAFYARMDPTQSPRSSRQKDSPRGHSAKPGGAAIGPPCPAGLSISATNSLDTNETLDTRVFFLGFQDL